ncbi:hypothetical protein AALC17_15000 [Oscillospiraceae bacterium 38-13]
MPASKAQQKAVNKYMAANYDRVNLTMPKGRKGVVQTHAAAQGESVNGFINRAIDHEMERDASRSPAEVSIALSTKEAVYFLPSGTIKAARGAAEAAGETLPVFVTRAVETQAQQDALSRKMKGGDQT